MNEKLLTCKQVANHFQVKVITVWAWIREGKLDAIPMNKGYRVEESAVKKFEKARKG